jgi:DNA-binding PadR family transcriptional regulator
MHQHHVLQPHVSHAEVGILAGLISEPHTATACYEGVQEATGQVIEPGAFSRMLVRLERRGWIEASRTEYPLHLYQITEEGRRSLERAALQQHEEQRNARGSPDWHCGRKIIMQLVLWVLRLYPLAWRERYEAEMVALLEQHQITLWTVLDLLVGVLDAWIDPYYRQARPVLALRRFQTAWHLVVGGLVAFWIALLPWLWMSVLGLGPETSCSDWRGNAALCLLRVTVERHAPQFPQALLKALLVALPLWFLVFLAVLVLARDRKVRTHLLLVLPVTVGMLVLCLACAGWLTTLWPLLPQISQFYPPATPGLLAGLIGMGLATLLALGSLARAAFALRALSAASPSQESSPVPSHQQAREMAQNTDTPQLVRPMVSEASRVSKKGSVMLGALFLLFAFPLPLLVPFDGPDLVWWLITWCPAGLVALIAALLVKSPGKPQAEHTSQTPRRVISPKVWDLYLLLLVLLFLIDAFGPVIVWPFLSHMIASLLLLMAIPFIPVLWAQTHDSHHQARGATSPLRTRLSPWVWVMITPVLFLVLGMYVEFLYLPDYPDFKEVLTVWFLTGLASLILLLAVKLGSRARTALLNQELRQPLSEPG